MPLRFRCNECDAVMKVPNDTQGKTVKCPKCHTMQHVPMGASEQAPPAKKRKREKKVVEVKQEAAVEEAVREDVEEDVEMKVAEREVVEEPAKDVVQKGEQEEVVKEEDKGEDVVDETVVEEKVEEKVEEQVQKPRRKRKRRKRKAKVVEPMKEVAEEVHEQQAEEVKEVKEDVVGEVELKEEVAEKVVKEEVLEEIVEQEVAETVEEKVVIEGLGEAVVADVKSPEGDVEEVVEEKGTVDEEVVSEDERAADAERERFRLVPGPMVSFNETEVGAGDDADEVMSEDGGDANQLVLFDGSEGERVDEVEEIGEEVVTEEKPKLVLRKAPMPSEPRMALALDGSGEIEDRGEPEAVEGEVVLVKEMGEGVAADEVGVDKVEDDLGDGKEEEIVEVAMMQPAGDRPVLREQMVRESHVVQREVAKPVAMGGGNGGERVEHGSGQGVRGHVGGEMRGNRTEGGGEPYFVLWVLSIFLRVMGVVLIGGAVRLVDVQTGPETSFATSVMWLLVGLTGCAVIYTIGEIAAIFREKMLDESE